MEGQINPCDVTVLPYVELSIKNLPINIDALNKAVLISVKANPSLRSFFEETPETQTKVGRFQVRGIQVLRHHVFGFFRPTHPPL